jgi:hypothetical protein
VVTSATGRAGVRIGFTDDGPGIPDVDLALTDGWTSGGGLGLGLSGARRLVDEFELTSKPGRAPASWSSSGRAELAAAGPPPQDMRWLGSRTPARSRPAGPPGLALAEPAGVPGRPGRRRWRWR